MNEHLLYLRKEHGGVFVTQLPSGQVIPWRTLSIDEYIKYDSLFKSGQYPRSYIEDEIFRKCVTDGSFVKSIDKQKAGIISTVVNCILIFSGPSSIDDVNQGLNVARNIINSNILHSLVTIICQAFPAYTPEDVYSMDYQTLMLRVAQSENKLISAGIIKEPITFELPEEDKPKQKENKRLEYNKNMINKYYEQQGMKIPKSMKDSQIITQSPQFPPTPKIGTNKQTIITKSDIIEHEAFMTGHDQDIVHKVKMADETAQVYSDYLKQIKEEGKLTIKTPEERKAAAEERMEANRQKLLEQKEKAVEAAKAELPELLKVREQARRRKEKRKAARRRK